MYRLLATILVWTFSLSAQESVPLRQAGPPVEGTEPKPLTLREATREDRWFGLGVRDVRWAPDGSGVFFRWKENPSPEDDPELDPWFFTDRSGGEARIVKEDELDEVPGEDLIWHLPSTRAAWTNRGRILISESGDTERIRTLYEAEQPARRLRFSNDGQHIRFMLGEDLFEISVADGRMRQVTRRYEKKEPPATEAGRLLQEQQYELFERHRAQRNREKARSAHGRKLSPGASQPIPVEKGVRLVDIQLSPDSKWVTFRWSKPNGKRPATRYLDYADKSGYATPHDARAKVGEPQDDAGLSIVAYDPQTDPEEVVVKRVVPFEGEPGPEAEKAAGETGSIIYGPYWSLEGDRAVVQVISRNHKDRWIKELDLGTGRLRLITHDHDDAWLGGPPPLAGYLQPVLLEWLPGGSLAFASERSGFSHLYLSTTDGQIRPLTAGEWEVREARLNRDRTAWLIQAGREHPCDDHLYLMSAQGGDLVRLGEKEGRHTGRLSPDGLRLAVVSSQNLQLPDLYLKDPRPQALSRRITISGSQASQEKVWTQPVVVTFPHPDGKPLWANLYKPETPLPQRPGVLHIHGGGYRQFSHRGWSVYGWATHMGFIQYLVQEGYTVLDFDYRGSAGFGRDYRTDIYRSMGEKDVTGGVAAVDYLVREHGVDRSRIGVYGLSYGGFFTLSALFKHPGVFAAGVANAAVSDWMHYNHLWTSRVLNLPSDDPEAYQVSSPINHAKGLRDPLLIVHGLIDDNVQFQDAARVVQKLIELEKDFEVMYYPMERHVITSEASRLDYRKRVIAFFERHLLRP